MLTLSAQAIADDERYVVYLRQMIYMGDAPIAFV